MNGVTDTILMIRPKNFGSNPDTIGDNHFQNEVKQGLNSEVKAKAIEEFDTMVSTLRAKDIAVIVIEDKETPVRPDAIFPNNWFTTHTNGSIITYPMKPFSRRAERREDVVDKLSEDFLLTKRYGFEYLEDDDQFLEGTGSMILDRVHKIVYAGLSLRTDIRVLEKFAVLMGYSKVVFYPLDKEGKSIYHTNVMMTLGHKYAVVCTSSIANDDERNELLDSLKKTGKELIDITFEQVNAFAGNMLQVKSKLGTPYLVMSDTAYNSLDPQQIEILSGYNEIIQLSIPTIETHGGGGVRCMMAEIFSKS